MEYILLHKWVNLLDSTVPFETWIMDVTSSTYRIIHHFRLHRKLNCDDRII